MLTEAYWYMHSLVSDACMLAVYTDAGYLYIYVACRLHVFFTHTGSSGKGSIHSSVLYWSASELNKGTQPYSAPVCVNYTTFTAEPVLTTCWQLAGSSKFLAPPPPPQFTCSSESAPCISKCVEWGATILLCTSLCEPHHLKAEPVCWQLVNS